MPDDDHPYIEEWKKNLDCADADSAEFKGRIGVEFVYMPPETRVASLNLLDQVAKAEDGTNLRQKARLLALRRTLTDTHRLLRGAGR